MKKFFAEFKEFISRGNVFDMAVGLIIATAFNKIVSSMVNDLLMPLITWATGAASLADLSIVLRVAEDGTKLTWNYGNFLQTVIDFFIIAMSVFLMVKLVNTSRKRLEGLSKEFQDMYFGLTPIERRNLRKKAKQEKIPFKQVLVDYHSEKLAKLSADKAKAEQEERERAEAERLLNPTETDLLKEIRDLLKTQNAEKKN